MPRLSFLYRTDTHVSDRSPISWKGDYPAEVWSNLEQVGQFAREHEVNAVLDGGDYFHVKSASRNSHMLVAKSASIHRRYPCRTFSVPGNHDIAFNNLETIGKQPLGVLYESGVFSELREEVFKDGDLQVRVVGVPYSPMRTLEELRSIQKKPGDTHLVTIVHGLAGLNPPPNVEDFFNEPVFKYNDLITGDGGPDIWMFGHWHKDQGIETIKSTRFVNQGALSRGALVRENLDRTPKIALIEFDGSIVNVRPILLSVAPAEDVFDLELKAVQETERRDIDQFVLQLMTDTQFDPELSIQQNIQSLGFADEVRDAALHYLDLAEAG